MGPLWRLVCVPAALAGAGYIAADRAVLREIGLEPVGRGLSEVRARLPRVMGSKPRIRQGGQVCHWELASADGALLSGLPFLLAPPVSYSGMGNGTLGGYGGALDGRDFAAVVPGLGGGVVLGRDASRLPTDSLLVVAQRAVEVAEAVPVPEPRTVALYLVGLVGLLLAGRRRRT